jgi:hypothetical protein
MENILNGMHIPSNINQAGLAHCKGYMGRALDHMIKMGDAYRAISKQHPEDLHTLEVQAAEARQIQMLAQFSALSITLWKRTHNQNKDTLDTNQVGDVVTSPISEDSVPQAIQPTISTSSPMEAAVKRAEATLSLTNNRMVTTISTSSQPTTQDRLEDINPSPVAMTSMETAGEAEATLSLPTNQIEEIHLHLLPHGGGCEEG